MRMLRVPLVLLAAFACAVPGFAQRKATVLLITGNELKSAWKEFADWKTALGKPTRIVTVRDIAKRYEGADIQQKIRACTLDHIRRHGTRWVVLGGDSQPSGKGHVPDRDTFHPMMRYADIPTDVYYISAKNWDANGDGIYGDWRNDRKELAYTNRNVAIGRIPVRTAEDVRAYTAKVKAYETRYPASAFATNFIYSCPIPLAYPKLNTSRKQVTAAWDGGRVRQLFSNVGQAQKSLVGEGKLVPDLWTKMINGKRAGKWHMHGHGFLPAWILEDRTAITKSTVAGLRNENAYPVITTVSCFTGQFDATQDPSIAESMLRKPGGGAIAIVAPSREGVPIFADPADFRLMITEGKMDGTTRMLTRFWTAGLKKNLTIGEAWASARAALAEDAAGHPGYHWCECELNLLGDPTLDIRSGDPVTPTIEAARSIPVGKQTVRVKTGVAGAKICLWMGDQVYETAVADETGAARVEITTGAPGQLLLTVSGPHLNARQVRIPVR